MAKGAPGVSSDNLVSGGNYKKLPQYLAAISATLGAFSLGTALGWTSPAELPMSTKEYYWGQNFSTEEISWIASLMPLGGAGIAYPIGFSVDWIGRWTSMLILVIPFIVSWAIIIWPKNISMLMAGRFILGLAGGAFAVAAPMYTGEIAHKDIRGTLGSYFQLMVTFGILVVYCLGAGVEMFIISLICGIIPLIFAVSFFFMPESPYYCITKGNEEKARKSLHFFRGKHYDISGEIEEMKTAYELSQQGTLMGTLKTKAAKKAMMISLALMFIQQFSGVNAVIMYTSKIFEDTGSSIEPKIATIILGVFQFVATFISTLVVDRFGRRILLLISSGVMCICTMLVAVYFTVSKEQRENITWLPLLALCLFIVVFSLGYGPIPWMILGELFPTRIKGFASSTASCFNWILAFLVTKFYTNVEEGLGDGQPFWIFMAVLFVGTIFVFFFVPETSGKSLAEIQVILGGGEINSTDHRHSDAYSDKS